jgi:hypothetical protein
MASGSLSYAWLEMHWYKIKRWYTIKGKVELGAALVGLAFFISVSGLRALIPWDWLFALPR